jgi:hypothetical protein
MLFSRLFRKKNSQPKTNNVAVVNAEKVKEKADDSTKAESPNKSRYVDVSKYIKPGKIDNRLIKLEDISIEDAIQHIENKRTKNSNKAERLDERVDKLFDKDMLLEAQELISKDVTSYYHVYAEAKAQEKAGNLTKAARIYWKNIYVNGTDAPANYKKLLIVLRKLNRLKDELKVAQIYEHFLDDAIDVQKIQKRIESIKKKTVNKK